MAKELERDLGLYAVITVSVGAMIGSGIFVLPGIAATIGGPAVILAYLLAGLIVLPAALSKAEMATALPQSGGTYLYIDRAMGPMMGTIAGLGVWFSLVFKSAFALVGLGAYLVLFTTLSAKLVALLLAGLIVLVNIVGVKKTGQFQAIVVSTVLLVLLGFLIGGVRFVQPANLQPFFSEGTGGLLAATGFVFVSYAGVTKIASVAEEVEDPGRNIPIGMLASVIFMMVVYTLIVLVIVGTLPPASACPDCTSNEVLGKSLTPMADAAGAFLGPIGVTVIAATAVLALTSMANAGVLSSSRYPLAMSRDRLAPDLFKKVSQRFRTPTFAILITGALLTLLVAFIPVAELAKLASAFKILVFMLINVALIAFREGDAEWYEPSFRAPWYPWIQFFGILGGAVLLTQMGTLPMVGAGALLFGGLAYYQFYVRGRTVREGVGVDALRRQADSRRLRATQEALETEVAYRVLVPVGEHTTPEKEALLIRLGADIVRQQGGQIQVIQFEEVPDQTVLPAAVELRTAEDIEFEAQSDQLIEGLDVQVEIGEVVSHDTKRAVVNYAKRYDVDLILADAEIGHRRGRLFGRDLKWLVDKAPCEVALVKRNQGLGDLEGVAVISDRGPFDPFKVRTANAIALESGAPIYFLAAVEETVPDIQLQSIRDYHDELGDLCQVPTKSVILREEDKLAALVRASRNADLVVMEAAEDHLFSSSPMAELPKAIAEEVGASVILVYPPKPKRKGVAARWMDRVLYR